jgi:hypothetical protein
MKKPQSMIITALLLLLLGCNSNNNSNSQTLFTDEGEFLVNVRYGPHGGNCDAAEIKEIGADINGNGELDTDEVKETEVICKDYSPP